MSGVAVVAGHVEVSLDELDGYVTWRPDTSESIVEVGSVAGELTYT